MALVATALVATVLAALGAAAIAQQAPRTTGGSVVVVTTLPAPSVALAPYRGGVAALGADGSLIHATRGGDARRLRRGLVSEVLIACEGALLAVDGSGRLTDVASGAVGPPVSLHATPLCLPGGRVLALGPNAERVMLLDASLRREARAPLAALPDAEPVFVEAAFVEAATVAIPVHPSLDYRHGVLGDEVEAGALAVVSLDTLAALARWDAPGRRVIEQRRLASFPAAGRWGMVATVSGGGDGGALVVLAAESGTAGSGTAELTVVATGPGIGTENRWRHVLGASGRRLYSLATPHLGGPLERWTLPPTGDGDAPLELRREAFALGVTSHTIGQRELDLGRLVPRASTDPASLDLLTMPTRDLRTLRLIACDGSGCRASADAALPGRLVAAPSVARDEAGGVRAWVATDDASLSLVTFPRDGILSEPE